ncbi:hypothetical protein BMS3Bbin03_01863 [bacterium BMS3Bbin03]|nr:hypothetical protein BMS3Bbin03_01863 [bacterium BMS3Bbin03]
MQKKYLMLVLSLFVLSGLGLIAFSCSTGVESSPDPGILRVTLQSDPADTFIVIINDTLTVSNSDSFGVTVFQGKVYHDRDFALLFKSTRSYRTEDLVYNIIKRENDTYRKSIIYESYVPPGDYDRLEIGFTASLLKIGNFEIPVNLPKNSNLLLKLPYPFKVFEGSVTEINLQISPFKSVHRYRDSYLFTRVVQITGVHYYK